MCKGSKDNSTVIHVRQGLLTTIFRTELDKSILKQSAFIKHYSKVKDPNEQNCKPYFFKENVIILNLLLIQDLFGNEIKHLQKMLIRAFFKEDHIPCCQIEVYLPGHKLLSGLFTTWYFHRDEFMRNSFVD